MNLRNLFYVIQSVNATEIRADYEAMQARKATLERTYKSAEKEAQSLQQKMTNVEQYLGQDKSIEQQKSPDDRENNAQSRLI